MRRSTTRSSDWCFSPRLRRGCSSWIGAKAFPTKQSESDSSNASTDLSPDAADDLQDIYDYIVRDSQRFASSVVREIVELAESIPQFPLAGRIVPEYQNPNLRERIYKSYRIIYRISEVIEIANIIHSARDLTKLL